MCINDSGFSLVLKLKNEADSYLHKDQWEVAKPLYEEALNNNPAPELQIDILNNLAIVNLFSNQLDTAFAKFKEAQRINSTLLEELTGATDSNAIKTLAERSLVKGELSVNIGFIFYKKGEYQEALNIYQEAAILLISDPQDHGIVEAAIGAVKQKLNLLEEALSQFERAANIYAAADLSIEEARILFQIGEIYAQKGLFSEAYDTTRKVRRLLHGNRLNYTANYREIIFSETGDPQVIKRPKK